MKAPVTAQLASHQSVVPSCVQFACVCSSGKFCSVILYTCETSGKKVGRGPLAVRASRPARVGAARNFFLAISGRVTVSHVDPLRHEATSRSHTTCKPDGAGPWASSSCSLGLGRIPALHLRSLSFDVVFPRACTQHRPPPQVLGLVFLFSLGLAHVTQRSEEQVGFSYGHLTVRSAVRLRREGMSCGFTTPARAPQT